MIPTYCKSLPFLYGLVSDALEHEVEAKRMEQIFMRYGSSQTKQLND